jgi:hypothetical protein
MAAVLGVEPWPYSYAELHAMSEHKRSDQWDHTAALRVQIAANNAPRGRTLRFTDFHPFLQARNRGSDKPLNKEQGTKLLDSVFGTTPRRDHA